MRPFRQVMALNWEMDILTGKFETSDRLAQFIGGPTAARLDLECYVNRVNVNDGA